MDTETKYSTIGDEEVEHWALFSGGHDSLVLTHYLMENGYTDAVLHIDTRTGVPENEEFVKDLCEEYDWPLRIEQSPITLVEYALELGTEDPFGFPSPRQHTWVYSKLKQEPLRTVATDVEFKPHFWTGVRREESENRMANIDEAVEEVGQWIWHAPIRNWKDDRMDEYMEEHNLPDNPVVNVLHRSGECFCGCFSNRDEDLIDLQANYPEHFERIKEMEEEVVDELGEDNKRAYWAHGKLSDSEFQHLKEQRKESCDIGDDEIMLCRDCRMRNLNSAADTDW